MQRRSQLLVSTRLQRINPAVFDDLHTLYGHVNANGDWVDGVFTAALRKALKVTLVTIVYFTVYVVKHILVNMNEPDLVITFFDKATLL